jgi:GntR family transcriptional regulator, transcriptional repressor for pyruvate dehydrogenase complex
MKGMAMPIERRRLTDQIIDQLLAMLAGGKLKPGDKLPPEPDLMGQFGVGRSSLREAVAALCLVGLLEVRPGHGTTISVSAGEFLTKPLRWGMMMNWKDKLHELVEARLIIEQAMAGMAAERATDEEIVEIKNHHDQLRGAKRLGKKAVQADLAFHGALAKASHNSILARFLAELRQPMQSLMEQKASLVGDYDRVSEQHEVVLEAVEAHNARKAQSAMREHLQWAGERLMAVILGKEPT